MEGPEGRRHLPSHDADGRERALALRAGGFELALDGKPRTSLPVPRKALHSERGAQVIALRLSPPPPEYATGSLRLLARRVVQLGIVESISHEAGRRTLERTASRATRCSTG